MPSVWEGLPVVGVEAQAADLPCVFSNNITREIGLTDKAFFCFYIRQETMGLSILEKALEDQYRKKLIYEVITKNQYNIVEEAKKLQERYIELYEENR